MPSDKRARQRSQRAARIAQLQRAQQQRRRRTRTYPIIVIIVLFVGVLAYVTSHGSSKSTKTATATTTTAVTNASTPTTTAAGTATTVATATPPTAAPVTGGSKITGATPCPSLSGTSPHVLSFAQAPTDCLEAGKTYTGTFETNLGNVVVSFDTTKTPETANNFIVLSLYHYFDGTALFRTDTSIGIIQGGAPHTQSADDPGPGYTIKDEGSGYTYAAGDLVMARTSSPNSAGAQFFFCVNSACAQLNGQGTYVVFGHVTSGLDVLQKILASNVAENNGLGGAPGQLVTIKTISITAS